MGRIKRSVLWIGCMLTVLGLTLPGLAFQLTFVHTSDIHARYEGFDDDYEFVGFDKGCGGSPRIAAFIEQTRQNFTNVLVVDTGDQFNKSPYFNKFGVTLVQANLKALKYDMISLGNHEFMLGARGFRQLFKNLGIPVLCANMDFKGHDYLAKNIQPWIIKEIDGQRVGFIGAVVGPKQDGLLEMEVDSFEPREYVEQAVKELQDQGVNKIILLSHCGYKTDLKLAQEVDGLDVILGGHTHLLFSNTEPDADVRSYPLVIDNGRQKVLLAHCGYYGKYAGLLQVTFNAAGEPEQWAGDSILMDGSIRPSARVAALFLPYKEILDAEESEIVGYSAVLLDGSDAAMRFQESAFGNLITDVMLAYGSKRYQTEVALVNGGSISGSIKPGEVSYNDVKYALYYNNNLVVLELTGADLQRTLEYGLSVANEPKADKTGRFLQVAGLKLVADLSQVPGSRLAQVFVKTAAGDAPLEAGRVYKVITYDFVAKGGDDNWAFPEGAQNLQKLDMKALELVLEHFRRASPVSPKIEGRIILLNQNLSDD